MVIVEGCDATGKTHLVNSLKEALGWRTIKDSFNRNGIPSYLDFVLQNPEHNIIADRFLYGEYVYPIVKRDGRPPLRREEQHLIERVLLMQPSVLIYCETHRDRIADTFDTRGEDFVTKADIDLILELFNERYELSLLPKMRYNWASDDPKQVLDFVLTEVNRRKDLCDQLAHFEGAGEYLDHPIMLVGESYLDGEYVGERKYRALSRLSGSSLYLSEALLHNPQERYYLTNALKYPPTIKNVDALLQEFALVQPRRVIALGNVAGNLLAKAGIRYSQRDHPSYRRRFLTNTIETYAGTLN